MTEKEKLKFLILNENLYRSYGKFLERMKFFGTWGWEVAGYINTRCWEDAGSKLQPIIYAAEDLQDLAKELQDNIRKMVELKDNVYVTNNE